MDSPLSANGLTSQRTSLDDVGRFARLRLSALVDCKRSVLVLLHRHDLFVGVLQLLSEHRQPYVLESDQRVKRIQITRRRRRAYGGSTYLDGVVGDALPHLRTRLHPFDVVAFDRRAAVLLRRRPGDLDEGATAVEHRRLAGRVGRI